MNTQGAALSLVLFISALIASVHSFFVSVDANSEECYFEDVRAGTKMTLTFEVAEGGFLDIDVKFIDPNGRVVYSGDRESNGKYTFNADVDGVHKYCFGNEMSSMTPKIVMFTLEVGDNKKNLEEGGDQDESHNKLAQAVNQLSDALLGVKHEQEFMEVRERVHRMINDNTNSRVVLWAFFEALVLVAMVLGQIYYLKRFFEVRRVI